MADRGMQHPIEVIHEGAGGLAQRSATDGHRPLGREHQDVELEIETLRCRGQRIVTGPHEHLIERQAKAARLKLDELAELLPAQLTCIKRREERIWDLHFCQCHPVATPLCPTSYRDSIAFSIPSSIA